VLRQGIRCAGGWQRRKKWQGGWVGGSDVREGEGHCQGRPMRALGGLDVWGVRGEIQCWAVSWGVRDGQNFWQVWWALGRKERGGTVARVGAANCLKNPASITCKPWYVVGYLATVSLQTGLTSSCVLCCVVPAAAVLRLRAVRCWVCRRMCS
jgi:hypothetical protein